MTTAVVIDAVYGPSFLILSSLYCSIRNWGQKCLPKCIHLHGTQTMRVSDASSYFEASPMSSSSPISPLCPVSVDCLQMDSYVFLRLDFFLFQLRPRIFGWQKCKTFQLCVFCFLTFWPWRIIWSQTIILQRAVKMSKFCSWYRRPGFTFMGFWENNLDVLYEEDDGRKKGLWAVWKRHKRMEKCLIKVGTERKGEAGLKKKHQWTENISLWQRFLCSETTSLKYSCHPVRYRFWYHWSPERIWFKTL